MRLNDGKQNQLNFREMKQSSIEFAVTSLEKLIPSGNQLVIGAILLQAKAMHKDEIENAVKQGWDYNEEGLVQWMGETYYNETFNTKWNETEQYWICSYLIGKTNPKW